jgi:hypothetical protein
MVINIRSTGDLKKLNSRNEKAMANSFNLVTLKIKQTVLPDLMPFPYKRNITMTGAFDALTRGG